MPIFVGVLDNIIEEAVRQVQFKAHSGREIETMWQSKMWFVSVILVNHHQFIFLLCPIIVNKSLPTSGGLMADVPCLDRSLDGS